MALWRATIATELSRLLGANIKAFRKNKGLTQERLAALASLSTPYVNLLEAGKKFPSEQKLAALANVLEVRPYELFVDPLVDSLRPDLVSTAVSEDFITKLSEHVQSFAQQYREDQKKK